jgi:hypothetical protein
VAQLLTAADLKAVHRQSALSYRGRALVITMVWGFCTSIALKSVVIHCCLFGTNVTSLGPLITAVAGLVCHMAHFYHASTGWTSSSSMVPEGRTRRVRQAAWMRKGILRTMGNLQILVHHSRAGGTHTAPGLQPNLYRTFQVPGSCGWKLPSNTNNATYKPPPPPPLLPLLPRPFSAFLLILTLNQFKCSELANDAMNSLPGPLRLDGTL